MAHKVGGGGADAVGLTAEELAEADGMVLPAREAMSIINPSPPSGLDFIPEDGSFGMPSDPLPPLP